ncbi:hypothetical protein MUK42_33047 [Musa troglodytarum]|uniref:Uncharacterized protein n=1 Tax=Musa troglodytarum TaxID=320322 RepID=A0A9E7LEK7_9LILI|nr:hypothetical protein MUK42_33047 [Musa troglodytarum]URE47837.1 hypothetical protein MUK42_33047 [Musa troglodytarum]URE47840.1 hypothetical protein MUK42_33047 [Musa troglodytarum]
MLLLVPRIAYVAILHFHLAFLLAIINFIMTWHCRFLGDAQEESLVCSGHLRGRKQTQRSAPGDLPFLRQNLLPILHDLVQGLLQ